MKHPAKAPVRLLTLYEAKALLAFAHIAGTQWRSKLRRLWASEGNWTGLSPDECAVLRQIRNSLKSANQFAKITLDHARLVILESTQKSVEPEPDFDITTFKPIGTGGFSTDQGVAVRITCKVTGITVSSHRERSQYRNKEVCWQGLNAARAASGLYGGPADAN